MKDKVKKIIILLLILLVICLVILLVVSRKNDLKTADYSNDSERVEESINIQTNNIIKYETNKNVYYTVVSVIIKYIDSVAINDSSALLNMLDSEYITKYNINEDNITKITEIMPLENDFQYYVFKPDTIYSVDEGKITTHFVYGYYYNISDMNKKNINLMIQLDTVNHTFNVYNYKYMSDNGYDNLKIGDSYNSYKEEIQNRENNTFEYVNITDEELASKYLDDYKNIILYDRTKAYQLLNQDYSELRFENEQDFARFAENKKIDFFKAKLVEYSIMFNESGNKIYICKDQNDNYYYFKETDGIMRYEVMLDNYTVPDDNFIKKYEDVDEQVRVALNIEKFVKSINDKCYYYAYNCLADSFRNNYFKTQGEFETYIQNNFYQNNVITYNSFEKQGDLYTYSVVLTDKQTNEQKNKTFIMKLEEGTNFVLSFDR